MAIMLEPWIRDMARTRATIDAFAEAQRHKGAISHAERTGKDMKKTGIALPRS